MSTEMLQVVAIAADVLLLFFSWLLIKKSNIIRDVSCMMDNEKPYSFARTQLMWWTVIVIGCFIYSAIVLPGVPNLNATALLLLGISAATTASGAVIDGTDMATLNNGKTPLKDDAGKELERHQDIKTKGFWTDILSDAQGVSIHRFQSLLFNIVYGITYILLFANDHEDPQHEFPIFNEFVLGLLGISSAGYIVLKTGENKPEVLKTVNENDPQKKSPITP